MTKRSFDVANDFQGLEEAIENILNDEDDHDVSYDLVAIPPDPSILTDTEEGDEDDVQQNILPRDIPGRVEVFESRNDDEWDSSDDEPLQRHRRVDIQEPRWRKCDGSYVEMPSTENNVQKRKDNVVNELKDQTPVNIFEKIFDMEVFDMIVLNTKLYAAQHNNHDFQITVVDIKVFFGILLLTGYQSLPRERLYWSLDEDCNVTVVSKAMSKNRFLEIKKFLHFCDNEAAAESTDKMFKVRPLSDILIKKFLQWGVVHEDLSVDESMVKYFGRHPAKQFIRGKPVRFGYKNWMLASADGYCYAFDIYCGKSAGETSNEPLGSKVVKSLLHKANIVPHEHIVYFDNFFTSHTLLQDLREAGYRATGTVRENRTKKCPLVSVKDMKKKNRAEFDYRFDTANQILFVRWLDNSVCTMGTNYDFVYPLGKVKRWSSAEGRKVDVDIPFVFQNYNKGMGGVDQADQSVAVYRTAIRGKKWWWVLFTYMLDLAVANAWRLHVLAVEEKLDQLQFRRSIARFYLRSVGTERPDGRRRKPSSVVPNCLHLQLYRDPKDRFKKGQTKASLSLQHFLGFESGFTLDKESNTIAIICQDVTVVLAFETRERLIAWQVKVGGQLGSSKEFLVMIGGGGSKKLPAGPARMHLQGRRFALTSGVPPRLLGLWELAHLRRYGVVEGRFCFEGGSHCGKGEGLHMLITDQAQDITDAFDMAAQGTLQRTPAASRKNTGNKTRPSTRLSDFNSTEQSIPDTASALYEENFFGEDCGGVSPYWPSDERRLYDDDVEIGARPPWTGADHITLERCNNCLTKLGAISRSSTVALTPGTTFNPAWTMEAVPESSSDNSSNSTEYLTPREIKKSLEACQCKDKAPERPPKPTRLDQKKPPAPLPVQACSCSLNDNNYPINNPKVGPYENYDVPKNTHTEIDPSEHYDTPKRIKKALADDLFKVTNRSAPGSLVLKKNCGCILKFASKKKPVIVECEENIQPVECPCQKVTNWANNLISLPYCKRTNEHVNTEILTQQKSEEMALYATIDVSRKTNRQSAVSADKENTNEFPDETHYTNYQNIEPKEVDKFEGPYANYENLEFALSLEYYENAKDLLKRAGVTQNELDALSANIDLAVNKMPKKPKLCTKCGHSQTALNKKDTKKTRNDEYLLMEPTNEPKHEFCTKKLGPNPGYTPMSPNPNWSQSLKHPMHKHRVEIEKSLSIPTLTGNESRISIFGAGNNNKESLQKRSSSVDSARLLEDLKEFDSSIGSHATSSSLETLRNLAIENRRTSSPCENETECYDCCKSSGSENKTSEESCSKEIPHLRNKLMDNAQIKRSSSVPCKSGGNRDSSSSNDSGVSSCSMKHGGPDFNEFEMPLTSGHSRYHYMVHKRMRGNLTGCVHSSLPRKSKSSDPLRDMSMQLHKAAVPAKSSSAEAEVPVLPPKKLKGVMDTHSTSSGTSDMSDYIETLSMTSSHSSSDTPTGMRLSRQPTNTLRPRSGKEYHNIDPIITSMYKNGKDLANYTNIP